MFRGGKSGPHGHHPDRDRAANGAQNSVSALHKGHLQSYERCQQPNLGRNGARQAVVDRCDDDVTHARRLEEGRVGLTGTIPTEIGLLTGLRTP